MAQNTSGRGRAAAQQHETVEGWLRAQNSANTRAAYRSDLDMFGMWCSRQGAIPLTADTATLVAFQAAREVAGDSPSTIRRRWSALSSFYDFAIEREMRSINPVLGVDRPRVESGDPSPTLRLSDEAVASYRAAAAAFDPRLDALVALLVCDGLKVAEALALDIKDVSGTSSSTTITVRRRGESKRIVLDSDSARAVRRCIGKRRAGPVFVNEQSSQSDAPCRLTRFGADYLIRQLRTDSMSEPATASALRRFHITTRKRAGTSLDGIREGAGLANVRGVRRYVDAEETASNPSGSASSSTNVKSVKRSSSAPPAAGHLGA